MLPILDEVAGSMCSGPAPSGMAGMLTREGTGDDGIDGEGIGGCKDASKRVKRIHPACTLLVHNLYIVDDIFEIINIEYF